MAVGALLVLSACRTDPADASVATTDPPAQVTTVVSASETPPESPPATIAAASTTSAPASTTTTTEGTSTTTAAPSTTTTEPTTAGGEPARSRPASPLPAPTGFARFEPGPPLLGTAALTGLAADDDVSARPALAVKIDNAPAAQPQWSLADADLVFEENVEGTTRFIAVFHSNVPDRIGPVRSARTSDIKILASLNRPVFAWSGGNPWVTGAVRGAHTYGWLSNLSAQSGDCFWRSTTRKAPHNLVLDPACAWASATLAGPARPVFAHDAGDPSAGKRESRFDVEMAGGLVVTWVWDAPSGRYLRRQRGDWHVDADGESVAATNVVEMYIDYVRSPADPRSPEAVTVGSGPMVLHRGGVAITGTWSRPDHATMFTLTADDGTPLSLAPGTAFVELPRR